MFRAVLFDFNGVLVDDEPIHLRLFREVLGEEGLDPVAALPEEEYWSHFVGFDDRACFTEVLEREGVDAGPDKVARLTARKASYYQELIRREGYPYFPGAAELVRDLAAEGVPLGVVSGALRDEVEGALRQEGLRGLFKVLVSADDVAASKPDPEGYRSGLRSLNAAPPLPERLLHPHETVAIEDTAAGIAAARAAGLATLAVTHTYPAAALGDADRVVERIGDLDARQVLEG